MLNDIGCAHAVNERILWSVEYTINRLTEQYSYFRFRWRKEADIDKLAKILREETFEVKKHYMPTSDHDLSFIKKNRDYLNVQADTLVAAISAFSATLSQKEKKAFTNKDMKLRQIILDTYPKTSSTPFPVGVSYEPNFEVEDDNKKLRDVK